MKNSLIIVLIIIAITMIVIGIVAKIAPPVLTGIGFIIIAKLIYKKNDWKFITKILIHNELVSEI